MHFNSSRHNHSAQCIHQRRDASDTVSKIVKQEQAICQNTISAKRHIYISFGLVSFIEYRKILEDNK
jgi:hypothetical protein